MSIKIKKDGQVREFILPATNIQVLDIADKFKKKDLENVIKEISDTEHIYVGEVDETKDGIWIDDGDTLDNAENNDVVERIKEYVDDEIKDYSNPNLLVNGDFQVWSNGTDITTTVSKQEVADKWNIWHTGMKVTKLTNTSPSVGLNSLKLINTMDTAQKVYMYQQIKDYEKLEGKRVTASFYIRGVGGFSGAFGFTVGTSAGINITVTNEWQRIIFSKEVTFNNANQDYNKGFFFYGVNSNLFNKNAGVEIAGCKLEIGTVATPFVPKLYSEELLACKDGVIGSNPNLLLNGDFSVWQRGTSFNISNNGSYKYTADRWVVQTDSTSITANSLPNNGMRVDMRRFAGTYLNVMQLLEIPDYQKLIGKDITIRVKFKNDVSDICIGVRAFPDTSATHVLMPETNNEFTITTKVPKCSTNCTKFMIYVQSKTQQILDFDYIKVELSSIPTPFVPKLYSQELADCQRYYEVVNYSERFICDMADNHSYEINAPFKVVKRNAPTQTITYATLDDVNIPLNDVKTYGAGTGQFGAYITKSTTAKDKYKTGNRIVYKGTADAEIY